MPDLARSCSLRDSMLITGPVGAWESWTEMEFPESGSYVVDSALVPITIDREADRGEHVEPNVWMRHRVDRFVTAGISDVRVRCR